MASTTDRSEYIAGLRDLADLLEQHPEVPTPYHGRSTALAIFTSGKDELIATARAIPGKLDKQYDDDSEAFGFELHGTLHGLRIVIYGNRNEVCRRIVTGTREVTKTVPTATEEVTVTEDVVEWVCSPLLSESGAS